MVFDPPVSMNSWESLTCYEGPAPIDILGRDERYFQSKLLQAIGLSHSFSAKRHALCMFISETKHCYTVLYKGRVCHTLKNNLRLAS